MIRDKARPPDDSIHKVVALLIALSFLGPFPD